MATDAQVKTVREHIDKALTVFEKDLVRRPQWGEITFEKAEADLLRAKDVLIYLKGLPIEALPVNAISNTTSAILGRGASIYQIAA